VLRRFAASCFEAFGLELRRLPDAASRDPFVYLTRALRGAPSPLIFDVGANVGQSIAKFRRLWPQSVIHAFEPGRTAFSELQRAVAGLARIELNHAAVGASAGSLEFQENSQTDMSSLLNTSQDGWGTVVDRYEVPVTTVDRYRAARAIPVVDILKIDTQGYDLQVLRGARESLEQGQVRFVLLELIFANLYEGQARVDEVFRCLLDHRMHLVGIYDAHVVGDRAGWADALFVADDARIG
jgi:FkbM family methyltransferase